MLIMESKASKYYRHNDLPQIFCSMSVIIFVQAVKALPAFENWRAKHLFALK
jgi:hypothetical protein